MALIILIAITLIGVASVAIWKIYLTPDQEAAAEEVKTIDEILELTVETKEVTSNLLSGGYLRVQYKIQADAKHTKEELEKRMFQIDHIILKTVSGMKADEIQGPEGMSKMENMIKDQINQILTEGMVEEVITIAMIVQ